MMNQSQSMPQPEGADAGGVFDLTSSPMFTGHPWRWLLLALLSCLATSAAAVGAFLWLVNLPPTINCDHPAQITTDRAALSCAQGAADGGNLEAVLAGLTLVQGWGPDHWLAHEINPLVEEWSAVVVAAAEAELRSGRRDEAEALIAQIPPQSGSYPVGQNLLAAWNQDWEAGSALVATAQTAIANQDWRTASAQVLALGDLTHPHWREEQVQAIARQIYAEQQAQAQIHQAVTLASLGGPEQLIAASRLVNQVPTETLARQSAQTYLDRWGDLLLAEGLQRWYRNDLDGAIQLGQAVFSNPNRAKTAQELIWLGHARQMARGSLGAWTVTPPQMARLYTAMLLANRIPRDSPYYPQAQSSVATWRTHLDGMATLQLAQLPGGIPQVNTLKIALRQAETIPPGHPRRGQAQTLIAHWRLSLEQLEDAPYLHQAHRLAQANTPEGLRQAIASARRIGANRALRQEAQDWIYMWIHRLQTLEDQPILDRAYQLAEAGQFSQAMATAARVPAGRALHDDAQRAIAQWQRASAAQAAARIRPQDWNPNPPAAADPAPPPPPVDPPRPRPVAPADAAPTPAPSAPDEAVWSPALPTRIETVPGNDVPRPTESAPMPPPTPMTAPRISPPSAPVFTAPPPVVVPPPSLNPPMAVPPAPIRTPPPHSSTPQSSAAPSSGDGFDPSQGLAVIYTGALYAGL